MNRLITGNIGAALTGATLAALLVVAACQSARGTYNPTTGEVDIEIVGDDGKVVTAKGFEAALKQAMQYKKEAEQAGDAAAAADWGKIINRLLDKKGEQDFSKALKEAQATGTVTQGVNANGEEIWSWVWNGVEPTPTDPDPTEPTEPVIDDPAIGSTN